MPCSRLTVSLCCALAILLTNAGCETDPLPLPESPECCDKNVKALEALTGERRVGCLTPDRIPSWAAVSQIDDLSTLSDLAAPFDTGEGRWLKFVIDQTADPAWVYFMDSASFGPHWEFTRAIGCEGDWAVGRTLGEVGYFAGETDSGTPFGKFYFSIDGQPPADFATVSAIFDLLREHLGVADGSLTYVPGDDEQRQALQREKDQFDNAPFPNALEAGSSHSSGLASLNDGVGFGRLRRMQPGDIPGAGDIPVFDTLPNDLPIVAGIITTTPQAGLAHVNLRAIQDRVPNVFVPPALAESLVVPLLGQIVRLEVDGLAVDLRTASQSELDAHLRDRRAIVVQSPRLDLSVTEITPLSEIGFADAPAFGVKSANLAELRRLGLGAFVPDGFAVPLSFYDRFMQGTGLDLLVTDLLEDPLVTTDADYRSERLRVLRTRIRETPVPAALHDAVTEVQDSFPASTLLRCRSSTNAEDLSDFSGAGLYRSHTHHSTEGHLSESIKQVFASLWTDRAFNQRQFHRIDQTLVRMGVLIHPSFAGELVNGVATTADVLYQWRDGIFYASSQLGEDLVTNPEGGALPEELYLTPNEDFLSFPIRPSSLSLDGAPLLSDAQLLMLSGDLLLIHEHFAPLYMRPGEPFAMEIEFKITSDDMLAIKQARPWVYGEARETSCVCQ